ncbi:MAG TPA: CRTAC1 family protein, partial [Gammaproteobacteria bacterium]|nr:CRTAC1 family protein [Gammaproteobacteria bacterium]
LLGACGVDDDSASGPRPGDTASPLTGETARPRDVAAAFVDVTASSNLAWKVGFTRPSLMSRNTLAYQVSLNTFGGAAAGDCDNDGDVDLFITYGNTGGAEGGGGPNRLYLNQLAEQGNGLLFQDFAEKAGVANTRPDGRNDRHSGPAFADLDGDGDLDLFLGGIYDDPNKIYENQGECRFVDVTSNSPDIENMLSPHTKSTAFGDYDLDGDLDMFLTHWATQDALYKLTGPRILQTDHLWRNESDESGIRFVNASEETGMSDLVWLTRTYPGTLGFPFSEQEFDFTFTATFARIDEDLWPDIAIAGDFGTTQLAINNGDGTFHGLENPLLRGAEFGMGSALGDIDNDGDLDWFISSIFGPGNDVLTPQGNRLYINNGSASRFTDGTARLGVADGAWGWAACFLDIDNDSDLDIYHTNGWPEPFLGQQVWVDSPARAFVMDEAGRYTEQAEALGLAEHTHGRGVVCADFDNDGDTDLLELTDASPNSARLWENRSAAAGRNFLRVRLEGLPPNTEAAGARIIVIFDGNVRMREITIGSNYISQNPTVQIFGLGSASEVEEILVEWPPIDSGDGPLQQGTRLTGPIAASQPDQTLVIRQPERL